MGELTEAERASLRKAMKCVGWKPFGDTAFDRELERGLYARIMPHYYQGLKEGYFLALAGLYRARFGDIPEALHAAIEAIDAGEHEDTLQQWVTLFATGSTEDVARAVLGGSDAVSTNQ